MNKALHMLIHVLCALAIAVLLLAVNGYEHMAQSLIESCKVLQDEII